MVLKVKPGELTTSLWTQIEFGSLLARELRKILHESFRLLLPTAADFATATKFLDIPKTGLRAGDAFHLAIAANHGARKIWSLDQGFIKAGKQIKLPVNAG